jgi:hypothetical protein
MGDMDREDQIDAGTKAVQPAIVDQIQAKLAEAESGLVISEVPAQDPAQPNLSEA